MADIVNWSFICSSECKLEQSSWQESSQTSCFMLQLNSLMFLCEWCGVWEQRCSFYNLWHYSNKENRAQDKLNTRLTCYVFALLVTTKSRGQYPQSLTSPPRVWQLAHSSWATYNGLKSIGVFTSREEWHHQGLFGSFIFVPLFRHQKDLRYIPTASGFIQWLTV